MTQRQINKLVKIEKILIAEEVEAMPEEFKDHIMNDIPPKKEKTLKLSIQFKNWHKNMIENNLYPSMPCNDWVIRHGSDAQPLDYDVNLDDGINYGPYKGDDEQ